MSQTQTNLPVIVANNDMISLPSTPAAFSSPYFPKDETPFTINTSAMESDNDTSPWIPDRSSSRRRHKQHQVELDSSPIQEKYTEDVLSQLLTTPNAIITDKPSDSQDSSHRYLRRTGRSTVLSHRNAKIHHTPSKQHVKKTNPVHSAYNKSRGKEHELPETPKISKKRILGQMSPTSSPNAVHNLEGSKEVGSSSISVSSFYSTPLSQHECEMRNEGSPSYTRKRHIRSRGRIAHRSGAWRRSFSSVTLEIPKLGRLSLGRKPPTAQEIDESIAKMVAFHNWLKPPATPPIAKSVKDLNNDTQEKEKNKKEKLKGLLKRWFRKRKLSFGWPAPNESESMLPRLELLPVVNEKSGKTRLEPFPKGSMPALDRHLENEETSTPVASVAGSIGDINDKMDDYPASRSQVHTRGYGTDDHGSVRSVLTVNDCLDDKGTSIDNYVDEGGCGPLGNMLAASGGLDDEVVMAL